jgi:carboxymethylenebutenolidase
MPREVVAGAGFCRHAEVSGRKLAKPVIALTLGYALLFLLGSLNVCAAPLTPAGAQAGTADTATVTYDSGASTIKAFVAKPQGAGKHPAVIVVHDNQGLSSEIRDTAQKFAAEGFVALAPDLMSRAGGTKTPEQSVEMSRQLVPMDTVADLKAAFAYLQKSPDVDPDKISVVGFGWGGWRSFALATVTPGLYRAVVYSGSTPTEGLQDIHASVMGNYGQYDFPNAGDTIWAAKTMKQLGKNYTSYIYPKVQSGFFDSKSRQYDAEAAKTAWTRTIEFLKS